MAKCIECGEEKKTIYDYRHEKEERCQVYVIFNNSKPPAPTGFCLECLLTLLRSELQDL
jgi:hypothetical protein